MEFKKYKKYMAKAFLLLMQQGTMSLLYFFKISQYLVEKWVVKIIFKQDGGKGLKAGKLEQLREKEGWIEDVLSLKKTYIWYRTDHINLFFHLRYLSFDEW